MYLPRSRGGRMSPRMAKASAWMPPPPTPCTARKPMSWPIDCAAPQRSEPTRKMAIVVWKMRLRPYRSDSLPSNGVLMVDVTR